MMTASLPTTHDAHDDVDQLLPWYVSDSLNADERARVDAHLAECAPCRAALADEAALRNAYRALPDIAAPSDMASAWTAMQARLAPHPSPAQPKRAVSAWRRGTTRRSFLSPTARRVATFAAAQAAVILLVVAVASPMLQSLSPLSDRYRGLSAAASPATGNVVAMFRPETSESTMRATLRRVGATIVDGPTAADAYVLRVAPGKRTATVKALRAQPSVLLAEPIGGEDRP